MTSELRTPLIIRTVTGNLSYFTYVATFKYLPMGIGQIIVNSNPFVVALCCAYLFKEVVGFPDIAGIIVAFAGIVIMATTQPPAEVLSEEQTKTEFMKGLLFALFTVTGISSITLSGRSLQSIHFSVIQLHYAFWGVIFSIILILIEPKPEGRGLFELDNSTIILMVVSGAVNTCGMYGWVYASHNAKPTTVSLLKYIGVLYYFLADILIFHLAFSKGQLIGAAIMVIANLAYVLNKINTEKKKGQLEAEEQEELVSINQKAN